MIRVMPRYLRMLLPLIWAVFALFTFETQAATGGELIFAAAVPFPTVSDEIYFEGIRQSWLGLCPGNGCQPLFIGEKSEAALTELFGAARNETNVRVMPDQDLLKTTWNASSAVALVPFDELDPRWKVLALVTNDSAVIHPFDFNFDSEAYPLRLTYTAKDTRKGEFAAGRKLTTNRDPSRLTSVTLTGTTALSRRLAYQLETIGIEAIIEDIAETVRATDFLHISNEASFYAGCPAGVPLNHSPEFCASPAYFRILTTLGVDIVELTGNHILDHGADAFTDAYGLFQRADMKTYGGGLNLTDASTPLHIEHNGNRLVFLGCNPVGPESVWATDDSPGAAPCDKDALMAQVRELRDGGELPIVTFQHVEYDFYDVPMIQSASFYKLAEAGAVIVSGSQAHIPQGFAFINDAFIHFGLGNFLFDQTSAVERDSFLDRHIFYDGRYLGVVLETIRRGDDMRISRLRGGERSEFLKTIFKYSIFKRTFKK